MSFWGLGSQLSFIYLFLSLFITIIIIFFDVINVCPLTGECKQVAI